ncbi:proton-conducting transporter membrane subunit [Rhodopirellula sp. MGV]|uniref:proton-conducting transporter transmembrane domain-containing protein n=1 Tax=Rhodopirellula sp. MGV TaxID=2023130 RepID=UPI000B96F9D5|nr:proton-conducting transporter membrane subunit [Rhodopirellula sp. MGV]OYP30424.1 oxidoreductase [Rhodopirellula sp. MGV]PNY34769.1 oxidoreductase [Rhodopirellula baltica]
MSELHLPWLELSVLIPIFGAIVTARLKNAGYSRLVCLVSCTATLLLTLGEWVDFVALKSFAAHDHWDVLAMMFQDQIFVIDELNAPLLPLAALLCLLTVLSTLRTKQRRFAFHWMLISEAILLATLSCRNAWGIVLLLVAAVFPVWLELRQRGRTTQVFTFHMALFVAALFIGQALVDLGYLFAGGAFLTFAGLLRTGIVPLHCWMTDLFEKASFGTALLFVAPMTGAYAMMRLVLPIAPEWALQSIAIVSLITAVYAGGMALVQTEARRFFCYLFLSHSSLVLVGLELATPIGLTGGLCVWLSVGLALGGFGLTLRCVEARTGQIDLKRYHGLYENMPTLAAFFLLTGLASIGFPGTIGFIGTELLIEGAVDVYPLVGMAVVVAAALNGIAILQAYFKIFTGTRHHESFCLRSRFAEKVAVMILTVLIIGGGLYPQLGVASRYHAASELLRDRSDQLNFKQKSRTAFNTNLNHDH